MFLTTRCRAVAETRQLDDSEPVQRVPVARPAPMEPERQLSKKEMNHCATSDCCGAHVIQELKKKEMEDLDAVLSELGLSPAEQAAADAAAEKKRKKKEKKKAQQAQQVAGESAFATEAGSAEPPSTESTQVAEIEDAQELDPEK
eukprot:scaffold292404_cov51-Prasinocladus_malaysianus.AAC.1